MAFNRGKRALAAACAGGTGTGRITPPSVAIVGSGFGGLCMAIQLTRAGITDFTVYEKSDSLGGTWRDNTYPGAACDVPSFLYSFSFQPKRDWTRKWAEQPEILDYALDLARSNGVLDHIRFSTEIASMRFDETDRKWLLHSTGGDRFDADFVVTACGQLNRPYIPDIPGLEEFSGTTFHSARWDHSFDFDRKSVAVVGNGASALQFIPEIAKQVESLTIFQRSATYVLPKPDRKYRPWETWVLSRIPAAERLYRWSIYWRLEARYLALRRDGFVGKLLARKYADSVRKRYVSTRLPEETVVPDYAPGCKRLLISNDYLPTLRKPHVSVTTSPIESIDATGVATADGKSHPADAIIFGTGFQTLDFLAPIEVTGRDGESLAKVWKDGAEAYLGVAVPGFPNLFILYGPNTNLGHNSILFMIEQQVDFILRCMASAVSNRTASEVPQAVMDSFYVSIEKRLAGTAWATTCHSWYKTATGKVTNNWPGPTARYWATMATARARDLVSREDAKVT